MIDGKDKFCILIHAPVETCAHYLFIIEDILNGNERVCNNLCGSNLFYIYIYTYTYTYTWILSLCVYVYIYIHLHKIIVIYSYNIEFIK